MIPLRAENKRRSAAVITTLLIVVNVVVFLYQLSLPPRAGEALVESFGVVPARTAELLEGPRNRVEGSRVELALLPLVTSMFLHGGWLHLLGNMLFLCVFGASVEDRLGHLRYLIFYLICGLGAGVIHIVANWGSALPSIGASGAISGVLALTSYCSRGLGSSRLCRCFSFSLQYDCPRCLCSAIGSSSNS